MNINSPTDREKLENEYDGSSKRRWKQSSLYPERLCDQNNSVILANSHGSIDLENHRLTFSDEGKSGPVVNILINQASITGDYILIDPYANEEYIKSETDYNFVVRASTNTLKALKAMAVISNATADPDAWIDSRWTLHEFKDQFNDYYELIITKWINFLPQYYVDKFQPSLEKFESYWLGENREAGFVYCLSDNLGHYKIGRSKKIEKRIAQLRTQPPFEIQLIHAHQVINAHLFEKQMHRVFASKRMHGEWFALSNEDIEIFKNLTWRFKSREKEELFEVIGH